MINCAVIGLGNMGKHHARVYSQLKSSNLVAVADIKSYRGRSIAEKFNCHFYTDYKEMIRNENIDAVSIAVPTGKHREVALFCINSKLHLLLKSLSRKKRFFKLVLLQGI